MRLIDADALTRELKSIKTTFGSGKGLVEGGLEIAISTTNAMPTISEWIPCSERLPSKSDHKDDMVLVCYGNGSVRFNTCKNGQWCQGNPLAWMPLPDPWKEGESNG